MSEEVDQRRERILTELHEHVLNLLDTYESGSLKEDIDAYNALIDWVLDGFAIPRWPEKARS